MTARPVSRRLEQGKGGSERPPRPQRGRRAGMLGERENRFPTACHCDRRPRMRGAGRPTADHGGGLLRSAVRGPRSLLGPHGTYGLTRTQAAALSGASTIHDFVLANQGRPEVS